MQCLINGLREFRYAVVLYLKNLAMADIILHHYPSSPFSEKIRAILGYKQLAWKSVFIPTVMPKPDLIALTGGYRKTPVMQIGCDIYCDTKLMARVLDQIKPQPPLVMKGHEASCAMQEQWTEQVLFFLCAPIVFQPQGMAQFFGKLPPSAVETFQKDRAALFSGGAGRRPSMAATKNELPAYLAQLDAQLASVPYIDGAAPTISDFSVYHPIWFVINNPGVASYFDPYKNILAWTQRIAALGQGKAEKMSAEEAIQIARNSKPRDHGNGDMGGADGLKLGETVTVTATDYGTDPVTGVLVKSGLGEIAIRRADERAGEVVVHFPRAGFKVAVVKA